jgi:hypothetical protein
LINAKKATGIVQRNVKAYLTLRTWGWFQLMGHVKPLLNNAKKEVGYTFLIFS